MDDFQQAFNDADIVLALPVYAAGEAPIDGISSDSLVAGLRDRGHRQANVVADADALASALAASIAAGDLGAGDMIICLGAGDITKMAAGLARAVGGGKGKVAGWWPPSKGRSLRAQSETEGRRGGEERGEKGG